MIPAELGWLEALWMIFWKIAIPASAGMVVGSSLIYGIGYWGGKPAITKWGKWFGIRWSDIEKAESRLSKSTRMYWLFSFSHYPDYSERCFIRVLRSDSRAVENLRVRHFCRKHYPRFCFGSHRVESGRRLYRDSRKIH